MTKGAGISELAWLDMPGGGHVTGGRWMPDIPPGAQRVSSKDVHVGHRSVIDCNCGLSILERV